MGRTQHCGQIPFQFNLKPALLAAGRSLDSTTAADDVRFQGACGTREDDGVDEAPNGFSGFGSGVGMLERLRKVSHLLPVELRHSRMQKRRRRVGWIELHLQRRLALLQRVPFGLQVRTGEPVLDCLDDASDVTLHAFELAPGR